MQENNKYDSIIIGSGPAGLTAAIYHARASLKTIVIAGKQPGGQLTITPMVDNYPGFPNGVGGFKLMMDTLNQVKNFGVEIKGGVVKKISDNFKVELENGEVLETKSIIVATGAQVKWLEIEREKELIGHGISGCATCDGAFFRDKIVAVVGGGDTACEDAAFLARFAKKVYLIVRRDELRASVMEQKKVINNEKIEIWWNCEVKKLLGKEKLEAVIVRDNKKEEEKEVVLDGLFVAIGYSPATDFLKGQVELKESGQIIVNEKMMSNIEGIFAAGDCVNQNHRQAIIAAGEGCRAALEAQSWLKI